MEQSIVADEVARAGLIAQQAEKQPVKHIADADEIAEAVSVLSFPLQKDRLLKYGPVSVCHEVQILHRTGAHS